MADRQAIKQAQEGFPWSGPFMCLLSLGHFGRRTDERIFIFPTDFFLTSLFLSSRTHYLPLFFFPALLPLPLPPLAIQGNLCASRPGPIARRPRPTTENPQIVAKQSHRYPCPALISFPVNNPQMASIIQSLLNWLRSLFFKVCTTLRHSYSQRRCHYSSHGH